MPQQIIYVITSIALAEGGRRFKRSRSPLVCSSLQEATDALKENVGDMHENGYYPMALVEPFELDVVYGGCSTERWWFQWNDSTQGYVPCAEPPGFAHLVALGGLG